MSKRATKKEQEIRVNHAANLAAEGQSSSSITSPMWPKNIRFPAAKLGESQAQPNI